MSKGKTEFKFRVKSDPAVVDGVIRNYLVANRYVSVPQPNANYYCCKEPMVNGLRCIEYYINGNDVTIFAYLGKIEKPSTLEGFVGCLPKQAFKKDLQPLFIELRKLEDANTGYSQTNYNQNMNYQSTQMNGSWNMQNYENNQTDPNQNTFVDEV